MENENTEYRDDTQDNSFIEYVFSGKPKDKNTIKLELPNPDKDKPLLKHIYEQLLQILVDGLKYKFGEGDKVNITSLELKDILSMQEYFLSFNVKLIFNMYTQNDYVFKPYIYGNSHLESSTKKLDDYYYEVRFIRDNITHFYRISFEYLY